MKFNKLSNIFATKAVNTALLVSLFAAGNVMAATFDYQIKDPLGSAASTAAAQRIERVSPDQRYINVFRGEIVTFVSGDKSFTWHFDTLNAPVFDLAAIAPSDFTPQKVTVYVRIAPGDEGA